VAIWLRRAPERTICARAAGDRRLSHGARNRRSGALLGQFATLSRARSSPVRWRPMNTAVLSFVPATIEFVFTDAERITVAGFLAGCRGLTREAPAPIR